MYQRLLLKNIHLLNSNILKGLLENKNIYLTDEESKITTSILKQNVSDLLSGNYKESFNQLKQNVSEKNYKLLYNLYFESIKKIS